MTQLVWHGLDGFDAGMQRLVASAGQSCRRGANNAAQLVASETKVKLTTSSHRKGEPTPSRPGEPPSLVSGTLRRSVKIVPAQPQGATAYKAQVGPTAAWARVQELGGDTGTTVLPARPYFQPTVEMLIGSGALWAAFASGWERF